MSRSFLVDGFNLIVQVNVDLHHLNRQVLTGVFLVVSRHVRGRDCTVPAVDTLTKGRVYSIVVLYSSRHWDKGGCRERDLFRAPGREPSPRRGSPSDTDRVAARTPFVRHGS